MSTWELDHHPDVPELILVPEAMGTWGSTLGYKQHRVAVAPEVAQVFVRGIARHGVDIPSVSPCLSSSLIHREVDCEAFGYRGSKFLFS